VLALLIAVVVAATNWDETGSLMVSSAEDVAHSLFSNFTLPFEVVSVLLLAAVIGGVFLAKRERGGTD
jgi:NADH:ubiquinone oxidoreductase subunit 6 (subunit J)